MKNWIAAAMGLVLMASPLAFAQDKGKADEKGAASAPAASKAGEKKAAKAGKQQQKREPTAKQKAQQEKMRACSKEARTKNLKGDERKKFMGSCMKG